MSENRNIAESVNEVMPEAFCRCWNGESETEPGNPDCSCGEELDITKWRWELPKRSPKWVDLYEDQKQVVFHPLYSLGTAIVKGNIPIEHNEHYYWEVKMLTPPYGTDIMVGVGSQGLAESVRDFISYLGGNEDSYGLSYTGAICQNQTVTDDCPGFCKGTIVGVMVDMFHGTLEFYLNREPQGISFTDLRRHKILYPMLSSTAAQSAMRLTYASSWKNSLLINAAKVLAASVSDKSYLKVMPPGLLHTMKTEFWIPLRSAGKQQGNYSDEAQIARPIRARVKNRRW